MKLERNIILILFIVGMATNSCESKVQKKVIATQGNYKLTVEHLTNYIAKLELNEHKLSLEEKEDVKERIVDLFNADPKETLDELESLNSNSSSNLNTPEPYTSSPKHDELNLAFGHKEIRKVLGKDIGQMDFNSKKANQFREYLANSLLQSRSNSNNSGAYSDSNTKIQFCKNGTYVEANYGHISVSVAGSDASSSGTDYIPGYWDVTSIPNGMLIILLYSKHPLMLADSPNGFIPFPIAKYTTNFVSLPNGDGYQRFANQPCN